MGMLGNPADNSLRRVANDSFNGDNSTVAFTLSAAVNNTTDIEVLVDNVQQSPYDGSYSVSGTTLTFSAAPATGTNNIYVIYHVGRTSVVGEAVPQDGSVTTAKIVDDAVHTSKIAASAVTLDHLHSQVPLGTKNLLINGNFSVWQRGTDLNTATVGQGHTSADRWTNQYCDFAPRIRQVEDTINGEVVDCLEVTRISGTYRSCEVSQKVETNTAKYLRGQTVTFSFWIKKIGSTFSGIETYVGSGDFSGTHRFDSWIGDSPNVNDTTWTNNAGPDVGRATKNDPAGAVNFTDNNWQKISITRTLSADTNTIYCTVYTSLTPDNEGIRIAKAQLEIGDTPTEFEKESYAVTLQKCLRYRYRHYPTNQEWIYNEGSPNSHNWWQVYMPVPMIAAPSLIVSNYNSISTHKGAVTNITNEGSSVSRMSCRVTTQNTGGTANAIYHSDTFDNATFIFNSEF